MKDTWYDMGFDADMSWIYDWKGKEKKMTREEAIGNEQEPCEDAISRQAVLDTISELNAISFYEAQEDSKECYYEIIQAIKDLSPVKPQTGHWIKTIGENGITSAVRCSECGFEDNRYMLFRYCPDCGVRMITPQESEEAKNGQIDKQTLWNKAGTSNHITRADVNVRPPKDNSGTQALNEGYAPISQNEIGE